MQQRQWVEYLQEFNFEITYKPGRENLAAEDLNKKVQILAISIINARRNIKSIIPGFLFWWDHIKLPKSRDPRDHQGLLNQRWITSLQGETMCTSQTQKLNHEGSP